MKKDEERLWQAVLAGESARDAGGRLGVPQKRVIYLCEKWTRAGLYNYGTAPDLGWVSRDRP